MIANPSLSPDGTRLAMDVADAKATKMRHRISDLKQGTNSRFTFDTAEDVGGVWSRDGSSIRLSLITIERYKYPGETGARIAAR